MNSSNDSNILEDSGNFKTSILKYEDISFEDNLPLLNVVLYCIAVTLTRADHACFGFNRITIRRLCSIDKTDTCSSL